MEILLDPLDINFEASRDKVQIGGSVQNVPETDETFVVIVQTSGGGRTTQNRRSEAERGLDSFLGTTIVFSAKLIGGSN